MIFNLTCSIFSKTLHTPTPTSTHTHTPTHTHTHIIKHTLLSNIRVRYSPQSEIITSCGHKIRKLTTLEEERGDGGRGGGREGRGEGERRKGRERGERGGRERVS